MGNILLFAEKGLEYMKALRAIIFDLGGTILDWPDINDGNRRWIISYNYLAKNVPTFAKFDCNKYVCAMREAELSHWQKVQREYYSSSPLEVLSDGFRRLNMQVNNKEILAALDGYSLAVNGLSQVFPDTYKTLQILQEFGYRIGLLSNTWWAAEWHNADLVAHRLNSFFDASVYTSDLPYSKPHPFVFLRIATLLNVSVEECVMVGDRWIDDISGALGVGMRTVWKRNDRPGPKPMNIVPDAIITHLADLPNLVRVLNEI